MQWCHGKAKRFAKLWPWRRLDRWLELGWAGEKFHLEMDQVQGHLMLSFFVLPWRCSLRRSLIQNSMANDVRRSGEHQVVELKESRKFQLQRISFQTLTRCIVICSIVKRKLKADNRLEFLPFLPLCSARARRPRREAHRANDGL